MSFIFGNRNSAARRQKDLGLNTINTATNEQANPLPYLAGKRRFSGTFITDAFDQHTSSQGSGGKDSGKGGGGSGTNYYAGFAVAFCLGPCDGFHDLWLNGEPVYTKNTPLTAKQLSQFNNVATFQSSSSLSGAGVSTGDSLIIVGADQPEFNGEQVVTVVDDTHFTYTIPGTTIQAEKATGQIKAWIKLDPVFRGAEDFLDITIPQYGVLRLYWGTETQPADDYLQVSGTNHPQYKGICYAVFMKFFLGLNQTNVQNMEVVLSRTPSAPWLLNPTHADIDDEANAAVVYYELLTHPRCGLGLTVADFNTAALAAAALELYNEGFGCSPLIDRIDSAQTLLQQLLQTIDAIPVLDANGLLSLTLIRAAADYDALPELVDADLADIPQLSAADWSNTHNQTRLIFPNRDNAWQNDFVEWQDFNAQVAALRIAQPQTINHDFLTRRDLALKAVAAYGASAATPPLKGKVSLLFTPALWSTLIPGTLTRCNFTDPTCARTNGIYRIVKRSLPSSSKPVFDIEFSADRSYLNQSFA